MAAGSVIKEPSKGTKLRRRKNMAISFFIGISFASPKTKFCESCKIGRVAAITIITKTNIGSV